MHLAEVYSQPLKTEDFLAELVKLAELAEPAKLAEIQQGQNLRPDQLEKSQDTTQPAQDGDPERHHRPSAPGYQHYTAPQTSQGLQRRKL